MIVCVRLYVRGYRMPKITNIYRITGTYQIGLSWLRLIILSWTHNILVWDSAWREGDRCHDEGRRLQNQEQEDCILASVFW
jgi:hypothetical protein